MILYIFLIKITEIRKYEKSSSFFEQNKMTSWNKVTVIASFNRENAVYSTIKLFIKRVARVDENVNFKVLAEVYITLFVLK